MKMFYSFTKNEWFLVDKTNLKTIENSIDFEMGFYNIKHTYSFNGKTLTLEYTDNINKFKPYFYFKLFDEEHIDERDYYIIEIKKIRKPRN